MKKFTKLKVKPKKIKVAPRKNPKKLTVNQVAELRLQNLIEYGNGYS